MDLKNKIFTIRGKQVMLDSDLASLYEVETKYLKRQVKRNHDRFPDNFCFDLTKTEFNNLRCQIGTSSSEHGGIRYLPKAFTQEGVAMLSAVLRSKKAVEVSIKIINEFIQMREFLSKNKEIFTRLSIIEKRQLNFENKTELKFDKIFNSLNKEPPKQGIFYDGQIFDAYEFVNDLINQAKNKITLIDNYVNYETLSLFKNTSVKIIIKTKITEQLKRDYKKYQQQYNNIELEHFTKSHDRFLIIDDDVYHIGASLKDLGKKWFAFSKIEFLDSNPYIFYT